MLLISTDAVGPIALSRMARDRMITPATRAVALPMDVEPSPAIRARCVEPMVPRHTALSGLAGWWVWHGGVWPGEVCVVGARGLHRTAGSMTVASNDESRVGVAPDREAVTFHSGVAWRDPPLNIGSMRIATPARCCIDALRWDDHRLAIPAVSRAVAIGLISLEELEAELGRDNSQGPGFARLSNLWRALYPVLEAAITQRDVATSPTARPGRRSA
jgi:hypothetical protein